ncbi:MAG: diaminopimelate decarboxylase [Christensenellales bacterium]
MPNFSVRDSVFQRAAEQFPTPFYLYDEKGIRQAARRVNHAFQWAPGFREYFAVKALPNPHILRLLLEEGCGLDCASLSELLLAERLGARGDLIMYSANAMPPEEFTYARKLDALINLDDISDIDTLLTHGGIPDTLCLRYNPGGSFGEGNSVMGTPGSAKYGMTRPQLTEGLLRLKALGLQRFGLHAFLASNMNNYDYYPAVARLLFQTGLELAAACGLPLAFLNLSGGVGIPYRPEEETAHILPIGQAVEARYREAFGDPAAGGVAIKTELGRYLTGPSGWLLTRAVHEKRIYKHYIGLDACAANLLRPAMYGAYHHISIVGRQDAPATHTYDITGSLCENNDKFAVDRPMPEIRLGDLLLIHDAGAHAFAMGYQYNGRLRSAEVLYREDGSFQLIRRAETPEDYFNTLYGEGLPAF